MVYLRWQLKHTSGWIEAPGYSSDCLFFFWTTTQAQRDHEIYSQQKLPCAATIYYGLQHSGLSRANSYSGRLADVGECRCNGLPDRKVLALLKDYVSVIRFSNTMQCEKSTEEIGSCGEKCTNLCRVYKLIMVCRVPGYGRCIQSLDYHVNLIMLL